MSRKGQPRRHSRDDIRVTWVVPDPPPTPEQIEKTKETLIDLVRALARMAAREDFERERCRVRETAGADMSQQTSAASKEARSCSRDWVWVGKRPLRD